MCLGRPIRRCRRAAPVVQPHRTAARRPARRPQEQRRAELVLERPAQHGVLPRQLQALAEIGRGLGPVPGLERPDAAGLIGQSALQQQVQLLPQRIGHEDLAVAPLAEMGFGLSSSPRPAIGHRERRVKTVGGRIDRQRLFQVLRGVRVVTFRNRDSSQAGQHGHGPRGQRERLDEDRLRVRGPALVEIQAAEPRQRGTSSGCNWSARANASSAFFVSPFSLCRCAR